MSGGGGGGGRSGASTPSAAAASTSSALAAASGPRMNMNNNSTIAPHLTQNGGQVTANSGTLQGPEDGTMLNQVHRNSLGHVSMTTTTAVTSSASGMGMMSQGQGPPPLTLAPAPSGGHMQRQDSLSGVTQGSMPQVHHVSVVYVCVCVFTLW